MRLITEIGTLMMALIVNTLFFSVKHYWKSVTVTVELKTVLFVQVRTKIVV